MLKSVESALGFTQPQLVAELRDQHVQVKGTYLLKRADGRADSDGPISEYKIEIFVPVGYPRAEPRLYEVGGRIPRQPDRHVNVGDGSCCVTVWENWLACAQDTSFSAYMSGPVHEYFLGQFIVENGGQWPFGERAHYLEGMEEAYADALKGEMPIQDVRYALRLLTREWPKGHWLCPCGSGLKVRQCHRDELMNLHNRIHPWLARQMQHRLGPKKQPK